MNDKPEDPLAETSKAPALARYAGAALFLLAAVAGITTIRACRGHGDGKSPPSAPKAIETQKARP